MHLKTDDTVEREEGNGNLNLIYNANDRKEGERIHSIPSNTMMMDADEMKSIEPIKVYENSK